MNKSILVGIITIALCLGIGFSVKAPGEEALIPAWIKNVAKFWSNDEINDKEFVQALQYLVEKNILQIPPKDNLDASESDNEDTQYQSTVTALNSNPLTFSSTTCRNVSNEDESFTNIAGKFVNGDVALDYVDIRIGLIDSEGEVVDTGVITLYDVGAGESRLFDEEIYEVAGDWESCEIQVEYVSEH